MKILIFGGTGNISTPVVDHLAHEGHDLTLFTTGRTPVAEHFKRIIADRKDPEQLSASLEGTSFDVAIDFLGFTREHCKMAYEALRGKIKQYIFISSATVYAKPHTKLPITEAMPKGNPFSDYAASKLACEEYLYSLNDPDFTITIIRPSHTFGVTWIPSPLHGFDWTVPARILVGKPVVVHDDGQSLWTLTPSSDFAEALAGLVGNEEAYGEDFHITSDQPLSWNCIYQEIGFALGKQPQLVHIPTEWLEKHNPEVRAKLTGDKAQHGVFDNTKIKKFVPDWECKKSFRTAIKESIAWYREDNERMVVNEAVDADIEKLVGLWETR